MPSDFDQDVIAEFRANQGRIGGALADMPIILIHHIGATSRTERVTPLAYTSLPDGRLIITASSGGSPTHPTWYHNLKAHPTIDIEIGTQTCTVVAEELLGTAYAELWPKLAAASPALAEYQAKTARKIPVFALTRRRSAASDFTSLKPIRGRRERRRLPPPVRS